MKLSQYNVVADCDGGIILYNFRTSKYVKIKQEKDIFHFKKLHSGELPLEKDDYMVKALYANGYIKDDDADEYMEFKEDLEKHFAPYREAIHLLLYVTEQCNFRCIYCPEEHINKRFSDETWEALYKHLENNVKKGKYRYIDLSFFGGEPLLEAEKIIEFLQKLHKLNEQYPNLVQSHNIVTNAYLLTPDVYDRLTEYDVKQFQITVDGFADSHDKMRPLAGGQHTWDRIIENLKYINTKNDNVCIILRTNYNDLNIKSLEEYKKWEQETFNNPKFMFVFHPVTNFSDKVPEDFLVDKNSSESIKILDDFNNGNDILKPFSGMCNSSYPNFYSISADGNISVCENLTADQENSFVGYLDKTGDFIFNDKYKTWVSDFELDDCKRCVIYPICCARKCPAQKVFTDRYDCKDMKDFYEERLLPYIQKKL